jgi:hypothetical protein
MGAASEISPNQALLLLSLSAVAALGALRLLRPTVLRAADQKTNKINTVAVLRFRGGKGGTRLSGIGGSLVLGERPPGRAIQGHFFDAGKLRIGES